MRKHGDSFTFTDTPVSGPLTPFCAKKEIEGRILLKDGCGKRIGPGGSQAKRGLTGGLAPALGKLLKAERCPPRTQTAYTALSLTNPTPHPALRVLLHLPRSLGAGKTGPGIPGRGSEKCNCGLAPNGFENCAA